VIEIELKFQIPQLRRDAVLRAVATKTAQQTALRALYFDTPDQQLARAGLVLRLRRENRRWVQTLKGRGDNLFARFEHEVTIPSARTTQVPPIDVARHAGTSAGEQLMKLINGAEASLQIEFETAVRRTHRLLRVGKSTIELCFDEGQLRAGNASAPICELELELINGDVSDLLQLATRWVERFGLWLDVRSKAERGFLLARGGAAAPSAAALVSTPPRLFANMPPDAALRMMVADCLADLLPGAAAVSAGGTQAAHLHRLRVALRRLRTALRVFEAWSPGVDPAWHQSLADLFRGLNAARDRDVMIDTLLPALQAAGGPIWSTHEVTPNAAADAGPMDVMRSLPSNLLLLALIQFAQRPTTDQTDKADQADQAALGVPDDADLTAIAKPLIKQMYRQLRKDAGQFLTLDDVSHHRTRRRLKRLRYAIEFLAPLFDAKKVKRYLARARPAQDALGELNDLVVAEQFFRNTVKTVNALDSVHTGRAVGTVSEVNAVAAAKAVGALGADSHAWFALGWISARRNELLAVAAHSLQELTAKPPPRMRSPAAN